MSGVDAQGEGPEGRELTPGRPDLPPPVVASAEMHLYLTDRAGWQRYVAPRLLAIMRSMTREQRHGEWNRMGDDLREAVRQEASRQKPTTPTQPAREDAQPVITPAARTQPRSALL